MSRSHSASGHDRLWTQTAVGVGGLALLFYVLTLAPDLVWGDGGRLQTDAITGASLYWQFDELADIETDGLIFDRLGVAAWDHPVWVMAGHGLTRLPLGQPNLLLNLLSAVPAAVTLAMLVLVGRRLGLSPLPSALGAGALGVSHTFWLHAVTAEVYALHAAFMATVLWLALAPTHDRDTGWSAGRTLVALAAVAGLGMANHLLLGLTVGGVGVYLATVRHTWWPTIGSSRLRIVGWSAVAFVVGFSPWWIQFLRMATVAGWETTWAVAWGFPWLGDRWPGPVAELPANIVRYFGLLLVQFTPLGVALGMMGVRTLWRRQRAGAVLVIGLYLIHVGFSANYLVADQFAFHLPSYVLFALCCSAGLETLIGRFTVVAKSGMMGARPVQVAGLGAGLIALPIVLYGLAPATLRAVGYDNGDLGIPDVGVDGRDGLGYYLNPNSAGDDSAAEFGRSALDSVDADAIVFVAWPADLEPYIAMRHYQLTEGRRPDVTLEMFIFTAGPLEDVVVAHANSNRLCRPLYLASLNPDAYPLDRLSERFEIRPGSQLYRLVPAAPETATPEGPADARCDRPKQPAVDFDALLEGIRQ